MCSNVCHYYRSYLNFFSWTATEDLEFPGPQLFLPDSAGMGQAVPYFPSTKPGKRFASHRACLGKFNLLVW